mmetsp:Transcript_35596/g.40450  ORF Transcript_35596/g.40450 Transcript_35596/m.40450 type:complete len:518 (-) Transcript_35596:105-1658(-)
MMSFMKTVTVLMALVASTTNVNVVVAQEGDEAPPQEEEKVPITPSYQYDMFRNNLPTCFDYRLNIDIGQGKSKRDCAQKLFDNIREQFETQSKEDWSAKWHCHGGLTRELMTLTSVDDSKAWWGGLEDLCAKAVASVASESVEKDTPWLEGIDLDEFYEGQGVLNKEYGNFHNTESEFIRRGGYDRYQYIGPDPRLNDYFPTTEESYQGGISIMDFYNNTLAKKFLSAPTASFGSKDNECSETSAAMCCWSGDRQYNDNNGRCGLGDCVNKAPGDNTDLCWTEDNNGDVFPYPNKDNDQAQERDLHCHGVSWSTMDQEFGDVNNDAKFNSLFYVSMYDHLYKRGYVNSLTEHVDFMGEQAMCGCVEDMNPVARADCTEAIGLANYTMYQDEDTGLLALAYNEDSFYIEFRACEGLEYKNDEITPADFQEENGEYWKLGMKRKTNDLSAFIYRQYLEGKTDEGAIEKYEETVVGYRFPEVNKNDNEREKVCKAAFEEKYPNQAWERLNGVGIDDVEEE